MATIKSYTDLQQSRKLAEILPLESADMYYAGHQSIINPKEWEYGAIPNIMSKYISFDDKRIFYPCWSLAALLNVLPRIDIEKEICSDDTYDYRVKAYVGDGYIGDWYDNPIDAVVVLIELLVTDKYLKV